MDGWLGWEVAGWQSWRDYRTVTGDDSLLQKCVFEIGLDVVVGGEEERSRKSIAAMADSNNNLPEPCPALRPV